MSKIYRTLLTTSLALLLASCASDELTTTSSNTQGQQGKDNNNYNYNQNQNGNNNGLGDGNFTAQRASSDAIEEDNTDYPAFLLRGAGTMAHKRGKVRLERKLTYRISSDLQHSTLDVTMAVSGDYARQVNESIINSGESSALEMRNKRASAADKSSSGDDYFKAYIYATELSQENTVKSTTKVYRANKPLPINVRPGSEASYESLQDAGGETYTTEISGEKNFTLKTRIEVISLNDREAVLKMTNSVPSDPSGQSLAGFPLPEEQTVTVDVQKKEIKEVKTKSFYLDGGSKYYTDMTYEICAFKKGGELTVYSLCNY